MGCGAGWLVEGAVAASAGEAGEGGAHASCLRLVSCRESSTRYGVAAECCEC